jgi:hypothetical protein
MNDAKQSEQKWFSQDKYRCRLEWGRCGAEAAARGDVLVVVDTLSFLTAVATAIRHGVVEYASAAEHVRPLTERVGAEVAVKRGRKLCSILAIGRQYRVRPRRLARVAGVLHGGASEDSAALHPRDRGPTREHRNQ